MITIEWHPSEDLVSYVMDELSIDLSRQNLDSPTWFTATARNEDGAVVGALVCEFWSGFDCKFSTAVSDEHVITPKLLHVIFDTLFSKVKRITAEVDPENITSIDRLVRMGFVYEGFKRRGLDGVNDAMIYGMLPEDCKFLTGVRATPSGHMTQPEGPDGITTQSA